jgi:PDZ domain/Aspartyl protease
MLRKSLIFLFCCTICLSLPAQIPGFYMGKGAKKIEIPFERQDNFIILKVLFEGLFPLRFILDTGAEHTILTKKEITNLLRVTYDREITIMGTDMKTEIKAYIARKLRMELPNLTLIKDILVLNEDYFKFDEFAGLDIQGIIGAEAFKGHIIKIDYSKQIITVYDPSVFKESDHRKFEEMPIQINRSKPYLVVNTQINSDTIMPLKLLIDTGAALALLLHTYSTPGLVMPPQVIKGNIGVGLGGQIEGYMGRLRSVSIGSSKLGNVISHFQELYDASDSVNINQRNGILGGEILSRFTVIIDFMHEKMYFQPNKYFKSSFEYDKSGLILVAGGVELNKFTVYDVIPDSPAFESNILRGDEIVTINRLPARFYTLGALNQKLQGKAGKKIRLVIKRDGKKISRTLVLRELI